MTNFTDKGRESPWWKNLPDPMKVEPAVTPSIRHRQQYLITQDMGYLEDRMDKCGFCKWAFQHSVLQQDITDYTIWVTECSVLDNVTGLPRAFRVYVRNTVKDMGHSANWTACYDHAYIAYLDYQQIMLDELHDWEKTDRWMQHRSGRI
jgi:hypothetical protein